MAWPSQFPTSLGGIVGRATHFQACHSVPYYYTTNDRSMIEENSKEVLHNYVVMNILSSNIDLNSLVNYL